MKQFIDEKMSNTLASSALTKCTLKSYGLALTKTKCKIKGQTTMPSPVTMLSNKIKKNTNWSAKSLYLFRTLLDYCTQALYLLRILSTFTGWRTFICNKNYP